MASTTNLGIEKINPSDYVDPEVFNTVFDIIDKLGVDYIVEQGISGEWWYRKWNSGRLECGIDVKSFGNGTTSKWGSMYKYGPIGFGAYPIAFKTPPLVSINYITETNGYGGMIHIHTTSDQSTLLTIPPKFSVADPNGPHEYKDMKFGIMSVGFYK